MYYPKLFDQLYNDIRKTPDFPVKKAEQLWSILPQGSRDLVGAIYLLPFGSKITEKEEDQAKVLTLLTLSAFTHGDLERNRVFSDGEAVLYGDYLFALAFSILPKDLSKEESEKLLMRSYHFTEGRLRHYDAPAEVDTYMLYAKEDYGKHIENIAEEAAVKSQLPETDKNRYTLCAKAIGTVWGILCEAYPVDPLPLLSDATETARGLPMETELNTIIKELEGAAGENHS